MTTAEGGPSIVTDGLVLHLDAANPKSYPGTGTEWRDLQSLQKNFTTEPPSLTLGTPVRTYPAFSSEIQAPEESEKAQDGYFSCDITFPSSTPSDSLIFETGGSGRGHFIGFKNGLLKVRVGEGGVDTETSLTGAAIGTTSNYPTDGQVHKLTWAWEIDPGRVKVFIDDELVIEAFTTEGGQLEAGEMAGTNDANYLSNSSAVTLGDPSTAYIPSSASELRYYSGIPQLTQGISVVGYSSNTTGTLTNGPTFNSENNGSIVFDGVDDYIELGTITTSNILMLNNSPFTINAWVYNNPSGDGWQRIVDKSNSGNGTNGYSMFMNYNEKSLYIAIDGGLYHNNFPIVELDIFNQWVNVTAVVRASNDASLYTNTNEIPAIFNPTFPSLPPNIETNMRIGSWNHSTSREFKGRISQVQIYNRALTEQEIKQNYNATKSRFNL